MRGMALTAVVALALAGAVSAAQGSEHGRVCGSLHASVPYSEHGNSARWGTYVAGGASCKEATEVLSVVMHLGGRIHEGSSEVDSYVSYRGWRCPFGQMGIQICLLGSPTRPRARALASRCAVREAGCPVHKPPAWFTAERTYG
jgi:hypothetical protein